MLFQNYNKIQKMKSLYLLFIFLPIICGCNSNTRNSGIADKNQQKDSVNAADTLYDFVSKIYKHNFMKTKPEVLDSLYLSSELYAFRKEGYDSNPDTYYNHWICDDIAYYPSFKIGKITQLSDTTATVDISISNGNSRTGYQLVMFLENGKWKVDDFATETSSEKYTIKTLRGMEIPLQGSMSEYCLKFCEQTENEHEGNINLYKNKTLVSQNIVSVGENIYSQVIADTKEGFKIIYCCGHNKYYYENIFLFKYQKGQFYLYKIIRYNSFEVEDGFDFKRTEEILETPILFQNVDFEKY